MIDDFLQTQGALRSAATGCNSAGETTYGTPAPLRCRMEFTRKMVTTVDGKQVLASGRAFLSPGQAMDPDDLITWNGRKYPVLVVDEQMSFDRLDHKLAWFGG